MTVDDFLCGILENYSEASAAWLVLSDWLEDQNDPRWEVERLIHDPLYQQRFSPEQREARLCELLGSGLRACVPSWTNCIGMKFALIEPGTFLMGAAEGEEGAEEDEHPLHEVEITTPFSLGVYQVTQEQYQHVVFENPSYYSSSGSGKNSVDGLDTRRFPVELVSWDEANEFCRLMSKLPEEESAGRVYRLPTEAEWEYCCRGGRLFKQSAPFYFDVPATSLSSAQANFDGKGPCGGAPVGPYLHRPCAVGSYPPNALGLFDMHGNVEEWCLDWHDDNYYSSSPRQDPQGPETGRDRVNRGGSWDDYGPQCRAAFRSKCDPDGYGIVVGFRVVCGIRSVTSSA